MRSPRRCLATAWVIAGAPGLLYLAVLAAALLCGLPWGLALFGSRHAAGWLAGALFGYWGAGFLWWLLAIAGGRVDALVDRRVGGVHSSVVDV